MPELPEVEITARLIGAALAGAVIESATAPGINAVKSFDPPLTALVGAEVLSIRRRGKLFLIDLHAGGPAGPPADLTLVVHLMSAGRLQLFERRAAPRDRSSRVLLGLADGRELRLREFGTRQQAWVKLIASSALGAEPTLAALGPEAWPDTPEPEPLRAALRESRPLHAALRDQHVIAGIGRSWVDEILHAARLSPFKRGSDLTVAEAALLAEAIHQCLGQAVAHYERELVLPLPDKLPMPLTVHRRNGEPCPRCGTTIEAVFYEDHVMCYCPACQTDGRVLKDRRLSRLLK